MPPSGGTPSDRRDRGLLLRPRHYSLTKRLRNRFAKGTCALSPAPGSRPIPAPLLAGDVEGLARAAVPAGPSRHARHAPGSYEAARRPPGRRQRRGRFLSGPYGTPADPARGAAAGGPTYAAGSTVIVHSPAGLTDSG